MYRNEAVTLSALCSSCLWARNSSGKELPARKQEKSLLSAGVVVLCQKVFVYLIFKYP